MLIELLFPFYDSEYLVWSLVCKSWHKFLQKKAEQNKIQKITNIGCAYSSVNIFEWSLTEGVVGCMIMASKFNNLEIMKIIYEKIEVRVRDFLIKRVPLEHAAAAGNLEMLKWLYDNSNRCTRNVVKNAARNGHLEIIKWLVEIGFDLPHVIDLYAAENGHLEIIKFLHSRGHPIASISDAAAYPETLNWMQKNVSGRHAESYECAIMYGNLDLCKWLFLNNHSWNSDYLFYIAAKRGHLDICKWLYENNYRSNGGFYGAVRGESEKMFEIIEWFLEKGFTPDPEACAAAIENKNYDVLNWLLKRGFKFSATSYTAAARIGDVELLELIKSTGCGWEVSKWLMSVVAAQNGHLNVLKWMRSNNIEFHRYMMPEASTLEVVKWLHEVNCYCEILEYPINGTEQFEIIKFIAEKGYDWGDDIFAAAICNKKFHIYEWAKKHKSVVDENYFYREIIHESKCRYDIFKWVLENISGVPRFFKNEIFHLGYGELVLAVEPDFE
jgi:hypothetical protein